MSFSFSPAPSIVSFTSSAVVSVALRGDSSFASASILPGSAGVSGCTARPLVLTLPKSDGAASAASSPAVASPPSGEKGAKGTPREEASGEDGDISRKS